MSAQALFDISSQILGPVLGADHLLPGAGPVPASPANRDYEAGFAVDLMLKDLTLAADAAASTGAAGVLGRAARAAYASVGVGVGRQGFLGDRARIAGRKTGFVVADVSAPPDRTE